MNIPPTSAAPAAASTGAWSMGAPAKKTTDAEQAFLDYAKMTPAQKMRAQVLDSMGLTEDQLNAMSGDARAKIEDKIKEMIKQKVEQATEKKTGQIVDLKA